MSSPWPREINWEQLRPEVRERIIALLDDPQSYEHAPHDHEEDAREALSQRLVEVSPLEFVEDLLKCVPGWFYQSRLYEDGRFEIPFLSATEELCGYPVEALQRGEIGGEQLLHEEDFGRMRGGVLRSARELSPLREEYTLRGADGELYRVVTAGVPHRLDDGSTLWNSISIDVTPLHHARQLFEVIFDALDTPGFLLSADMRLEVWNRAAAEQLRASFGVELEEGLDLSMFADLELMGPYDCGLEAALEGRSVHFRRELTTPLRGLIHLDVDYLPVTFADETRSILIMVRDVTEEIERAREKETLAAVLAQLPTAVILLDEQWRIITCMARAMELFACDDVQKQGVDIGEFFLANATARWAQALERADAFMEDTWAVRADGTRFPAEVRLRRLGLSGAYYVLLLDDVSARRELEEELRQAQKMELLGMLTSGVAHDLNNLLTVILGHLELAEDELPSGHVVRDDLEGIRAAVDRAAAMTVKLLAFARTQVVEPQNVDMIDVISQMRSLLERSLHENIRLRFELTARAPIARVDVVQMEQLLINLVVNARDAIGDRAGEVVVALASAHVSSPLSGVCEDVIPEGDYVVLSVRDDGEGIPELLRERIFEPFFTTKREGHGTGLGLATCRRIVRQNDAFMRVESEIGQGTLFQVWLPRAEGEVLDDVSISSSELGARGGRILLVEDDRALREAIRRTLTHHGYDVSTARDGLEALELLEAGARFDLLVTDAVMPGMGGVALVDRVFERTPGMPTLLISGYADEILAARDAAARTTAFLPKPFTPRRLAYVIQELLVRDGA